MLTACFWVGSFLLFAHTLRFFQTITALGPVLTQRLLVMLFVSFFAILLISNVVTALTTYYLSADVRFLMVAPVPRRRLHQARFVETLVASSWMVLLFGLPVFLAYGSVYGAGPLYYVATLATMIPFLAIPAALGVTLTTVLVLVFPARRMRDVLVVASVALIAGGYLALRLARPERLASPAELAGFAAFLAAFEAPASPYLPTTWAANVLLSFLGDHPGEPLFHLALLASTAAVLVIGCGAFVERVFLTAWSRAQEGREGPGRERMLGRFLDRLASPLPHTTGLLFVKDATIFFRDAQPMVAAPAAARARGRVRLQLLGAPDRRRQPASRARSARSSPSRTSASPRSSPPRSRSASSSRHQPRRPLVVGAPHRADPAHEHLVGQVLDRLPAARHPGRGPDRHHRPPARRRPGLTVVFMATLLLVIAAIVSLGPPSAPPTRASTRRTRPRSRRDSAASSTW